MTANASPSDLAAVLQNLACFGASFHQEGADMVLESDHGLPPDLMAAVRAHKPALLTLCALRTDVEKLHTQITHLRCHERTGKAERSVLLAFLSRQIERLAERCDLTDGYTDPSDPFADTALEALRLDFAELTAEKNPYPLGPLSDDPFSQGRYFNGKSLAAGTVQ